MNKNRRLAETCHMDLEHEAYAEGPVPAISSKTSCPRITFDEDAITFVRRFDDYEQYLDYLYWWYENWGFYLRVDLSKEPFQKEAEFLKVFRDYDHYLEYLSVVNDFGDGDEDDDFPHFEAHSSECPEEHLEAVHDMCEPDESYSKDYSRASRKSKSTARNLRSQHINEILSNKGPQEMSSYKRMRIINPDGIEEEDFEITGLYALERPSKSRKTPKSSLPFHSKDIYQKETAWANEFVREFGCTKSGAKCLAKRVWEIFTVADAKLAEAKANGEIIAVLPGTIPTDFYLTSCEEVSRSWKQLHDFAGYRFYDRTLREIQAIMPDVLEKLNQRPAIAEDICSSPESNFPPQYVNRSEEISQHTTPAHIRVSETEISITLCEPGVLHPTAIAHALRHQYNMI